MRDVEVLRVFETKVVPTTNAVRPVGVSDLVLTKPDLERKQIRKVQVNLALGSANKKLETQPDWKKIRNKKGSLTREICLLLCVVWWQCAAVMTYLNLTI